MNTPPFGQRTAAVSQPLEKKQESRTRTELQLDQANEVVDLMLDDMLRIKALLHPHTPLPEAFVTEIEGICDRAVNYSRQRVPLIEQRDNAERERDRLRLENYDLKQQIVYMEDVTAPDGRPSFQQGGTQHEIQEVVTAEFCAGLVAGIARLRAVLFVISCNRIEIGGQPEHSVSQIAAMASDALDAHTRLWLCSKCNQPFEEADSSGVDVSETCDGRAVACPKCWSNNLDTPGVLIDLNA